MTCDTGAVRTGLLLCVGGLMLKKHAGISQAWICTCCHTGIEVADQTFYLIQSVLTPGQPVPAMTLQRQAAGRVATGLPSFKLVV